MPSYLVTDTRTGERATIRETTDWDAWMAYRFSHPEDHFARQRFRATGTPGAHHYAIEKIDPTTGEVVQGTYLTMLWAITNNSTATP
jgi:hypothetical protein